MPQLRSHYVRAKLRPNQRLSTPLESVVYHAAPDDRLVLREDVIRAAAKHYKDHPEDGFANDKLIAAALDSLLKAGAVKEVHWARLARLLEEL